MRKSVLSACVATLAFAGMVQAAVYNGNGATGFGGGIGNSVLTVTDGGSAVNFSITSASVSYDGNPLVIYFDTVAGGDVSNATYTDTGGGSDIGRTAISGYNAAAGAGGTPTKSLVVLPAGFGIDRAASAEVGSFAGLFNPTTTGGFSGANFAFLESGGIAGSGLGPITFSFTKASLGLPASGAYSFNFVGTLISGSGYRSNETYGASVTLPAADGAGNGGFTGTQTFSEVNTFTFVPEPSSLAVLGLGAAGLLRRRK